MVEKLLVAKLIAEWMLQAGGFQAVINWLDGQCWYMLIRFRMTQTGSFVHRMVFNRYKAKPLIGDWECRSLFARVYTSNWKENHGRSWKYFWWQDWPESPWSWQPSHWPSLSLPILSLVWMASSRSHACRKTSEKAGKRSPQRIPWAQLTWGAHCYLQRKCGHVFETPKLQGQNSHVFLKPWIFNDKTWQDSMQGTGDSTIIFVFNCFQYVMFFVWTCLTGSCSKAFKLVKLTLNTMQHMQRRPPTSSQSSKLHV